MMNREMMRNSFVRLGYAYTTRRIEVGQHETNDIVSIVLHLKLIEHGNRLGVILRLASDIGIDKEEETERRERMPSFEVFGIAICLLKTVCQVLPERRTHRFG